jgi:hypothetical protein
MAITDRRLKLLNFPKENVSDLRAALMKETRGIVNNNKFFFQPCSLKDFLSLLCGAQKRQHCVA